jgi:hypothetical protein
LREKGAFSVPSLLPTVIRVANERGFPLRGFEAARLAKKLERRFEHAAEPDPMKYVLDYWDETGEFAIENVQTERNKAAAARRVAA